MKRKLDYYAAKAVRGDDDCIFAAWDTETEGLGGRLLSMQYVCFGEPVFDCSENMVHNFFEYLWQHPAPVIWYAHFSEYDWRYIMDYMIEHKLEVEIGMRTDNNIYQITIRRDGQKYIMRDSFALWNSSLEKLADSFCPEIPKLKIDIENYDPHNPEHREYALRDVVILKTGLPRLNQMLTEHFKVNAAGTTAGTAMKAWQVQLPKETVFNASKWGPQEQFIREGYYGGIVFLTNSTVQHDAETFDINSSYPASMCDYGVPWGRTFECHDYQQGHMGLYRVRVRAPENLIIPILPGRDAKGNMRWYAGEFDTVVTNRELVFAAQNGYEILKVYEGLAFEQTVFPFNSFIEKCKAIRVQYKHKAEEMLAKLMQNSLYGKYASRRERLRLLPAHCMTDVDFMGAIPYDAEGNWYVVKELDEEMRALPQWAAFITAHSRLRLLQAAYSVGPENVLYGDTDSLTIKKGFSRLIDVGSDYGQFKLEKEWKEFRAIAPKVYTGILTDGTRKGAAKGMPKRGMGDTQWRELLEDGQSSAHTLSLQSLKLALKSGKKPAVTLLRKSSTLENSCNFIQLPSGDVRVKIRA